MKNILFLLLTALLIVQCKPTDVVSNGGDKNPNVGPVAQPTADNGTLDRSIPPSAGPAPEIKIGDYDKFTLSNGVEVIVVKNDKLPRVSFSLQVDADPMLEGDKAGVIDLTGQLMRRGTKKRSKAELDEEIDFIGASLSTSGSGVFASSLSKHQDKLLDIMSDVLLNPAFKKGELDKLKKQAMSGLASQKDNPNAIAGNVSSVLKYGKNHPYGEIENEKTVESVTTDDCKSYYQTYFRPNTTRLVIVGDVDKKTLKGQLEKYFGEWEKGKVPTHKYAVPAAPKAAEVAFVDKAGAVQSVIQVTYPVDYKPGSEDAIKARVMATILGGGGFSGRLMQNLREDKAYTYGAYASLSSNELVGSFTASASVRNEVTDSAVTEFLYEMNRMTTEKVDQDDLNLILNQLSGSFSRALERPETVARFAQNIEKYDLPKDYYKNYLKKLRAVTVDDIQVMAKKYLTPKNAYILVVGNKDEVAPKLKKFSATEKVTFYDAEGNVVKVNDAAIPSDVTGKSIIAKYIKAIGGMDKLKSIEKVTMEMGLSLSGQALEGQQSMVTGKSSKLVIMAGGQPVMTQEVKDGGMFMNGQPVPMPDEATKASLIDQTYLVSEVYFGSDTKMEVKGMEKVDGKDAYKVLVTSAQGSKTTMYFDKNTGFKLREIETAMGQTSTSDYSDYKEVDGIMVPYTTKQSGQQAIKMTIKSIKIN
jgi:predicted Zn-dependent peptidase